MSQSSHHHEGKLAWHLPYTRAQTAACHGRAHLSPHHFGKETEATKYDDQPSGSAKVFAVHWKCKAEETMEKVSCLSSIYLYLMVRVIIFLC